MEGMLNLRSDHGPSQLQDGSTASAHEALSACTRRLEQLQVEANRAIARVLSGKEADVSHAVAAMQRSNDAFKMLLAIRGRAIVSYAAKRDVPI